MTDAAPGNVGGGAQQGAGGGQSGGGAGSGSGPGGGQGSRRWLVWSSAAVIVVALGLGLGLGLSSGGGAGTTDGTTTTRPPGTTTTTTTPSSTPTSAGSSSTSAPAGTTTTAPGGGILATGTYVAGSPGTPHYVVRVTSAAPDAVAGSVQFVYQDGRTVTVLTFTGTTAGPVATLRPTATTRIGNSGRQRTASLPPSVTATLGRGSLVLQGCTGFLTFATTASDCAFTLTSGGGS